MATIFLITGLCRSPLFALFATEQIYDLSRLKPAHTVFFQAKKNSCEVIKSHMLALYVNRSNNSLAADVQHIEEHSADSLNNVD